MVKIVIEHFSEEALRKLYLGWLNKEEWDEECNGCKMPALLHVDSDGKQSIEACPGRKEKTTVPAQNKADAETWNLWKKNQNQDETSNKVARPRNRENKANK